MTFVSPTGETLSIGPNPDGSSSLLRWVDRPTIEALRDATNSTRTNGGRYVPPATVAAEWSLGIRPSDSWSLRNERTGTDVLAVNPTTETVTVQSLDAVGDLDATRLGGRSADEYGALADSELIEGDWMVATDRQLGFGSTSQFAAGYDGVADQFVLESTSTAGGTLLSASPAGPVSFPQGAQANGSSVLTTSDTASVRSDVLDDTTLISDNPGEISFGANLVATADASGNVTVDVPDPGAVNDTRTNVSHNGTTVTTRTNDVDFRGNAVESVADDGTGGTNVTLSYVDTDTDTHIDVQDGATTVRADAPALDAGVGLTATDNADRVTINHDGNATTYKGRDIDTDGDGTVDRAAAAGNSDQLAGWTPTQHQQYSFSESFASTDLPAAGYIDFLVPIPPGDVLRVKRWGCSTRTGPPPAGLVVQLIDPDTGTAALSRNTAMERGNPIIEETNSGGTPLEIAILRVLNDTTTDFTEAAGNGVGAHFAWTVSPI